MQMLEEIIKFLGGAAILMAGVAWLIQKLTLHKLKKDSDEFQHGLKLQSLEHQFRTEKLHEIRAIVIADLYKKIFAFLQSAESYTSLMEFQSEPDKDEKESVMVNRVNDFWQFYRENKIYFPAEICALIDELLDKLTEPLRKYSFWRIRKEKSDNCSEKHDIAWDNVVNIIEKDIPPLLNKIENDFRNLLGVK